MHRGQLSHPELPEVLQRAQRKPITELLTDTQDNYIDTNAHLRAFQERRKSTAIDTSGGFNNIMAKIEEPNLLSPSSSSAASSQTSVRRRASVALATSVNDMIYNMKQLSDSRGRLMVDTANSSGSASHTGLAPTTIMDGMQLPGMTDAQIRAVRRASVVVGVPLPVPVRAAPGIASETSVASLNAVQILAPEDEDAAARAAARKAVEDKGFIPLSPKFELTTPDTAQQRRPISSRGNTDGARGPADMTRLNPESSADAEKSPTPAATAKRSKSKNRKKASELQKRLQEASKRLNCEIPHSIELDVTAHAVPIVMRMVDLYRSQLGERSPITVSAVKHLERLNAVATRTATVVPQEQIEANRQTVKKQNKGDKAVTIQLRKADFAPTPRPIGIVINESTHSMASNGSQAVLSASANALNSPAVPAITMTDAEGEEPPVDTTKLIQNF